MERSAKAIKDYESNWNRYWGNFEGWRKGLKQKQEKLRSSGMTEQEQDDLQREQSKVKWFAFLFGELERDRRRMIKAAYEHFPSDLSRAEENLEPERAPAYDFSGKKFIQSSAKRLLAPPSQVKEQVVEVLANKAPPPPATLTSLVKSLEGGSEVPTVVAVDREWLFTPGEEVAKVFGGPQAVDPNYNTRKNNCRHFTNLLLTPFSPIDSDGRTDIFLLLKQRKTLAGKLLNEKANALLRLTEIYTSERDETGPASSVTANTDGALTVLDTEYKQACDKLKEMSPEVGSLACSSKEEDKKKASKLAHSNMRFAKKVAVQGAKGLTAGLSSLGKEGKKRFHRFLRV